MFVALQGPVFGQLATQLLACIGAVSLVGWVVLGTGRVSMLLGQDCAHQAPEKVIVELPSKKVAKAAIPATSTTHRTPRTLARFALRKDMYEHVAMVRVASCSVAPAGPRPQRLAERCERGLKRHRPVRC